MEALINDPEAIEGSPALSIAHKMSVEEYERLTIYSERLEENWGKPPGNLNSDETELAGILVSKGLLRTVVWKDSEWLELTKSGEARLYFLNGLELGV